MGDGLRDELRRWFGHGDFRAGQREIVEAAMEGRDTVAILPTGGGKSLTYQLPALLLPGVTLVLSPLIALMKDQAENLPPDVAERVTVINSSLEPGEMARRLNLVRAGRIKIVYAAPERLRQMSFLHALRRIGVSLVVVDEAHCISQWGHDFRPDYRAVGQAVAELAPRSVLAVTATATPDVANDIERQLGRPLHRIVRPTFRDNLFLESVPVKGEDDKLRATLDICQQTEGVGLVYAGSREKCEQLSRMLARYHIAAGFYHAGLPPDERAAAQDRFMNGNVRVMAATVAFGMGVDKSDIRFLVHFHPSRTLENYYQEAGRAGRDGQPSRCILLHSPADATNARRRMREDTLTREGVRAVYNAVKGQLVAQGKRTAPISQPALVEAVGGDEGLVRSALPLLEETGLLRRYSDLPRRMALHPDFTDAGDKPYTAEILRLLEAIGRGGDFDPVSLSETVGVPLPALESMALECQDMGLLTYRPGPRDMLFELRPSPPDAKARLDTILAERARGAEAKTDAMLAYAREPRCRHQQIARYFGDTWPRLKCGACDVCVKSVVSGQWSVGSSQEDGGNGRGSRSAATPPDHRPLTTDYPNPALAALEIVADLTSGYRPFAVGKPGLVRILRGTPDAPVRPERTAAFGAMADAKKAEVERLIDALTDGGFLRRDDNDEYRRLYLTDEGREALRDGDLDVEWQASVAPKSRSNGSSKSGTSRSTVSHGATETDEADADPELLAALREWRAETANVENLPAYVIFHDKTLVALAARQPANEFDLLDVPGIGPAKAARYGDAILAVVRKRTGSLVR